MYATDKELLERILVGDNMAFELFYNRYKRLFYGLAFTRTRSRDMTCDIMQNFWIIIWKNPSSVKTDEEGSAKSYLYKYFTSRMIDYLNSADARVLSSEDGDLLENVSQQFHYTHVLEELDTKDIYAIIDKTIERMPELTQNIFVYCWKKGYSEKEVIDILGVSESTVRTRYKWAISFLQRELTDYVKTETSYTLMVASVIQLLTIEYGHLL
ncbi:sigma-70 family RNA polymerase sigma factor [uncultured Bacteroides sp.]|uniref:sigma-70 family RNA polymerase sigma factor n=1 Tax=uncultured Bacteroides sp. TaxID=162156 RepID=UPI002AA6B5D7|nr:sigma-70 family RNA polymerase sigma factor [uncultured Bacteroides sp.]